MPMKMTVPDRATRSCGGVAIAASLVLAAAALFPTAVAADSTDSTARSATATSVRADSVSTTADGTDASTRAPADTAGEGARRVGEGARTHHRDHDAGRHDVDRSDDKATVPAAACAPATQSTGVARCPAAQTPPATNVPAPPSTTGGAGSGAGSAASAGGGGTLPLPLIVGPRSVRHTTTAPSSAHSATARGTATAPRPAPVLQSPPSTSTVLGPVPLLVPIIDGVASEVGALPLQWLVLLTVIDVGLVVAIVRRRRHGRGGANGGVS